MNAKVIELKIRLQQETAEKYAVRLNDENIPDYSFKEYLSDIDELTKDMVSYIRKHHKQTLEYSQKHIPLQTIDIFIEALTNNCILLILSQRETALTIPAIFHALILYKHPIYYSILHKGLTLEEFNKICFDISYIYQKSHNIFQDNFPGKDIIMCIGKKLSPISKTVTEHFNYFTTFDYKRKTETIISGRNRDLPILNNSYSIPIYYTRAEIMKKRKPNSPKYILLINPYGGKQSYKDAVKYNDELPDINSIIHDDGLNHCPYTTYPRNFTEKTIELHLFNGNVYHDIIKGEVEDIVRYIDEKRFDDIPIDIFISLNIYPPDKNRYLKLVINDISPKLSKIFENTLSISRMCSDNEPSDLLSTVKITGDIFRKILGGYSLKTIDVQQLMYVLSRDNVRAAIYAKYIHRNPNMKSYGKFKEMSDKLTNTRKMMNGAINGNRQNYNEKQDIVNDMMRILESSGIEKGRIDAYKMALDMQLQKVKIPLDAIDVDVLTDLNAMVIG
jgi:hypothetical protein